MSDERTALESEDPLHLAREVVERVLSVYREDYIERCSREEPESLLGLVKRLESALECLPYAPEARWFPVVGGGRIPWAVAELAYVAYAARYGNGQSLERLGERGGFHVDELDTLLPDWRDRVAPRTSPPDADTSVVVRGEVLSEARVSAAIADVFRKLRERGDA